METVCSKSLDNSKYCHNYVYEDDGYKTKHKEASDVDFLQNEKLFLRPDSDTFVNYSIRHYISNLEDRIEDNNFLIEELDHRTLPKLSELIIKKNSYARSLYKSMSSLFPHSLIVQIIILLYLRVNGGNGHSPYIPIAYHGVCYPDACTMRDINTNNIIFSELFFHDSPKIRSLPSISYPGCTDDPRYNVGVKDWKTVNWVAILTLGFIGFLIAVGTFLDVYHKSIESKRKCEKELKISKNRGLGLNLLTAFSMVSNLGVIFSVSPQKVKY